jgi:hypothetical protein
MLDSPDEYGIFQTTRAFDKLEARFLELRAELEACREDAERYRWLRAQHWNDNTYAVVEHPKDSVRLGWDLPYGDRLDRILDAVRKGEEK